MEGTWILKYNIRTTSRFDREFKKLDRYTQRLLMNWIKKHLENTSDPRSFGKALSHDKKGLWRYRIGDYRIICEIEDNELVILMLTVGHRSTVYVSDQEKPYDAPKASDPTLMNY